MPIYDGVIQNQKKLPTVSLNPAHKYRKDNAFQTCFTGNLTDKAIESYALLGRYGSAAQEAARRRLGEKKAKQNVTRTIEKILANKYVYVKN